MTAATYQEQVPVPVRRAPLIGPDGSYTRGGQTLAFVLGLISLIGLPATVAAAILYTEGEARFASDPAGARTLVIWSWIVLVAWPVIFALLYYLIGVIASAL